MRAHWLEFHFPPCDGHRKAQSGLGLAHFQSWGHLPAVALQSERPPPWPAAALELEWIKSEARGGREGVMDRPGFKFHALNGCYLVGERPRPPAKLTCAGYRHSRR